MRYCCLFFLILTLFACNSKQVNNAKDQEQTKSDEKTSIEFKTTNHNFGQLNAGEIVLVSFEFTNTGKGNYNIENVISDCACISSYFTKKRVKPGETGLIEIEFNTAGLVGREYKTIEVVGNSKELKHLAIFAEVKNELIDIKY